MGVHPSFHSHCTWNKPTVQPSVQDPETELRTAAPHLHVSIRCDHLRCGFIGFGSLILRLSEVVPGTRRPQIQNTQDGTVRSPRE